MIKCVQNVHSPGEDGKHKSIWDVVPDFKFCVLPARANRCPVISSLSSLAQAQGTPLTTYTLRDTASGPCLYLEIQGWTGGTLRGRQAGRQDSGPSGRAGPCWGSSLGFLTTQITHNKHEAGVLKLHLLSAHATPNLLLSEAKKNP